MLCEFVFCSFYTISQKIMYETIYFCCQQSLILHPPFLVHTLSRISSTWPLGLVSVRSLVTLLNVDTQLSAPDLLSVFPVNSQMALLISSSLNVSAHSTKRCKDKTTSLMQILTGYPKQHNKKQNFIRSLKSIERYYTWYRNPMKGES